MFEFRIMYRTYRPVVLDVYATAISTLDNYFFPRKNKIYERHIVRQQVQLEGESMDINPKTENSGRLEDDK